MGVIARYKFNQELYANFIPEFNTQFINYTITDEIDADGYTIRTIESDSLPTLMRFGQARVDGENENGATDKSLSLLEVYECDTSNIINMGGMFQYCSSLTSLDLSNFNTSKVTNMYGMFIGCSSLTSLDVSNFDTSQVTIMCNMFNPCSSLTSLDVSNFNTSKVTDMSSMFNRCSSLTSLDVSNFNTGQVTNMSNMFYKCSSLTSLDVSNFNTKNVTTMQQMFQDCSSLTSLDVSNFDTSQVDNMNDMFNNCSSLTSLDVSKFNTSQVTNIQGMFYDCSLLTSLDVSNFNTENVTNMTYMFQNCSSLTSLNVSNFNTKNVTNMSFMFYDCSKLTSLDVSNFNTENVTNMNSMFRNCSSLTSLDVSNFNTEKVTNIQNMFNNCSSLILLDISNFDTGKVSSMENVFTNCPLENIGMIYCNSSTINFIISLFTSITFTIWYMNIDINKLNKKDKVEFKEYKMNILESDDEIILRRIGNVYDELNLETDEYIQRVGEIVLDGSENWEIKEFNTTNTECAIFTINIDDKLDSWRYNCDKFKYIGTDVTLANNIEGIYTGGKSYNFFINVSKTKANTVEDFKNWLSNNNVTIQYQLATPVIKTINLKGKPSINWQGDTYLHLENNTLYPQLDCEIESINYYEIPKLKANTLYTLRYVGEPTQCIFGGLTYETENNMILTSGSSDNLLYFDKEVRKVVLIEGDVRDRNFDYFEGIESLGAVEIVTHKSDMPIFAKGGRK